MKNQFDVRKQSIVRQYSAVLVSFEEPYKLGNRCIMSTISGP